MLKTSANGLQPHARVVMTRWTVLIGAAYLVLYGHDGSLPLWQQGTVLGALLLSLGLHALAIRSANGDKLRWLLTLVDIALATSAVAVTGQVADDFFLFFFLTLMIAGISGQFGLTVLATAGVCAAYGGLMFAQHGAEIVRQTEYLIRLPFLFGVGLFFGTVSDEAQAAESRVQHLSDVTRKMVHRYHQVASERDRSQSLLEIGQLALSGRDAPGVLKDIVLQIQSTVRVDRCSMLIFNESERHAYLAACTDPTDDRVSLLLPLRHYPELQDVLEIGQTIELHPARPSELWDRVKKHLPKPHQYQSWLIVPIARRGKVAGAICLRDSRPDFDFHEDEKLFCEAAALMTATFLQGRDLVEEMRRRSRLDGLTGLLNFMAFREELESSLEAQAETPARDLSLIMVDVDNLKIVNDRHGHLAGNQAIERVGRELAKAVPMAIAACRYGGDEFFALVPMDKKRAEERAERLLIALEERSAKLPFDISVSIGVAGYGENGTVDDELLAAADRAMYIAKSEGGNRVQIADEDEERGRVYEAVIAVNARRLIPGEHQALRDVLEELLRLQEQELDSAAAQQSLRALMEAVESKDRYTREYSNEVSDLTRNVGLAVGLGEREILAVEIAALVHDIGKIGIPDDILQKPGPLTTRERMQIEQHPEIGAQILRPLPAMQEVVPLVLHHHERWDGAGYPHGLAGEDIPIGAQIISLCDVWNALTSDRSYRKAFPAQEARRIVMEGRGTEWKPELVDVFFEVLEATEAEHAAEAGEPRRTA
ncbi:MAG: diguanylate cyclase [Acidobacteria bacterium]|nr:diguanylate cyclase [Acidobacteriota bacterium]